MIALSDIDFEKQIVLVINALSDAGYDPYTQLTGYLQTGDATYITRKENARTVIQTLDRDHVAQYVQAHLKQA